MMELVRPFGPVQGTNTSNAAVTGSSAATAVPVARIGFRSIRIANIGTQNIFVKLGASDVTTLTTTGMPVLANTVALFLLRPDETHIAAIAATTGSTMYLTVGDGI